MQTWARVLFVALFAFVSYPSTGGQAAEAPRMAKEQLKAQLGHPDVVVIDVRAFTDWVMTKEKIKGAVRENPRDVEDWSGKYPKDRTIVLYCT
jgi:rhodanese-related sulfurtransferase